MRIMKYAVVFMSVVLLTACGGDGLQVTASFENTQDIEEGDKVYFDGKRIGEVSDVTEQTDGSLVELELKQKAAKLLSSKSAIVVNRLKSGAPLEIYTQAIVGEDKIQDGQELQGLDSMFQLGAWMVGDAIQIGSGSISKYVGAFQKYLGSDEFESDKKQVEKELTNVTKSAAKAVQMLEDDVTQAINGLSVNEEQIAEVMDQLGEELSPVVTEVAKSSSELVNELEKFANNLESLNNQSEKLAGEKLMQSLQSTIEKLNKSFEQGVQHDTDN